MVYRNCNNVFSPLLGATLLQRGEHFVGWDSSDHLVDLAPSFGSSLIGIHSSTDELHPSVHKSQDSPPIPWYHEKQ